MKGLVLTCSLLFSAGAVAAPVSSDEFKSRLLEACYSVTSLNHMVQHASPKERAEIVNALKTDTDGVAFQLSKPLPQAYSAIRAGLNSIIEYSNFAPRSEQLIADHSAVLGMWCVQDTADAIIKAPNPVLQEQDVQVELIDLYSEAVSEDTK